MKMKPKRMPFSVGLRLCACLLSLLLFPAGTAGAVGEPAALTPPAAGTDLGLDCRSAVLMEAETGQVLYAQNAEEPLPPASVTKIMTLLLVMEAIGDGRLSWDDELCASENAASMGGSQIFLEPGESMTVRDLVKSVVISSANDAAVVLAEAVAGSEAAFVERMNARAAELGMETAHFENTNGLDDTTENHVLSALDVARMSRALIAHREILEFSSTWMDTVRGGTFGLSNTNRLIRTYPGANGLKTGSTAKALFCVSATAERGGMTLIAVIMAAPSRDARNAAAAALLDWGFANFSVFRCPARETGTVPVTGGTERAVPTGTEAFCAVVPKGAEGRVETACELPEALCAPLSTGEEVGRVTFSLDGAELGSVPVVTLRAVGRLSFRQFLGRMLRLFCLMKIKM